MTKDLAIRILSGDVLGTTEQTQKAIAMAVQSLEEAPTVDVPDRKVGEWTERKIIEDGKAIEEWQSARCSVCGKYHTTPYMYYFDNFNYCPNCGARMKGEDNATVH